MAVSSSMVVNTNADRTYDPLVWTRPAGAIEITLTLLPLIVGLLLCAELGAPVVAYLGLMAFSLSVATIGRWRRRRQQHRLRRVG
jgi:hypothetical protein